MKDTWPLRDAWSSRADSSKALSCNGKSLRELSPRWSDEVQLTYSHLLYRESPKGPNKNKKLTFSRLSDGSKTPLKVRLRLLVGTLLTVKLIRLEQVSLSGQTMPKNQLTLTSSRSCRRQIKTKYCRSNLIWKAHKRKKSFYWCASSEKWPVL